MIQGKRRPWLDADNKTLISLWDAVGSVALIAILMQRTPSSVQTQASRLGLPQRAEERDRHRRRWADGDDEHLNQIVVELSDENGKIPIRLVADRMGRSVDAIVAKLISLHGEDSDIMLKLVAPQPDMSLFPSEPVREDSKKNKIGKTKKCLKCHRSFWSGGNHNWICTQCKRSDDWDFD